MSNRAVFLDRDGVINRAIVRDRRPYPPRSIDELEILPGVAVALNRLRAADYLNIVVTNQPDVARGMIARASVEAIHAELRNALALDAFYTCWHADADGCECRKPNPGLLLAAARDYDIDLSRSYMVGDRWRDVLAGQRAGCRTAWIRYGYNECEPSPPIGLVTDSLSAVAEWILNQPEQS